MARMLVDIKIIILLFYRKMTNPEHDKELEAEIKTELAHIDVYRDTPIRLLGYANEVGEAFRSMVHVNVVRFSYLVAFGYVCADTFDKSQKAYNLEWKNNEERRKQVIITMGDTLCWQSFASVIIPGFTINRLCALTAAILKKTTSLPSPILKTTTTLVGLSAIPFIVKPIDAFVELSMDQSLRKLYKNKFLEKESSEHLKEL
uniref:Mitochondrial fission process protein 1 n=1 Tax=Acrobeloides nanus TaxID=290746 RepID=A0A914DI22_9BILA